MTHSEERRPDLPAGHPSWWSVAIWLRDNATDLSETEIAQVDDMCIRETREGYPAPIHCHRLLAIYQRTIEQKDRADA